MSRYKIFGNVMLKFIGLIIDPLSSYANSPTGSQEFYSAAKKVGIITDTDDNYSHANIDFTEEPIYARIAEDPCSPEKTDSWQVDRVSAKD